jgi:hypothetical protein
MSTDSIKGTWTMARHDLIIRGGAVVTAGDIIRCDIAVKDGRIALLGHDLTDAEDVVDATGKLVLPGGIDSHLHVDEPPFYGVLNADDFESASVNLSPENPFDFHMDLRPSSLDSAPPSMASALDRIIPFSSWPRWVWLTAGGVGAILLLMLMVVVLVGDDPNKSTSPNAVVRVRPASVSYRGAVAFEPAPQVDVAVIISKNRNPFKLSLVTGQVPSSPERASGRLVGK